MIKVNSFYVYEWFMIDTLEVFYVGKGTGMRRFEFHNRNRYFKNIHNKYDCAVRVVHQSLTNEEACRFEIERISEMKLCGWAKCNFTNGGTGFSTGDLNPSRLNPKRGDKNGMRTKNINFKGKNNPFAGRTHTVESKKKISMSRKGKGSRFGKDNPMYGKGWKGDQNPMYGRKGFDHPHSKMYLVQYHDGTTDTLSYKQCEKKFGIAFSRLNGESGILHYKKKTPNMIYEGIILTRLK